MQAENALDQMDWIEKINGVIASLLSSQVPEKVNIHDFANVLCYYSRYNDYKPIIC